MAAESRKSGSPQPSADSAQGGQSYNSPQGRQSKQDSTKPIDWLLDDLPDDIEESVVNCANEAVKQFLLTNAGKIAALQLKWDQKERVDEIKDVQPLVDQLFQTLVVGSAHDSVGALRKLLEVSALSTPLASNQPTLISAQSGRRDKRQHRHVHFALFTHPEGVGEDDICTTRCSLRDVVLAVNVQRRLSTHLSQALNGLFHYAASVYGTKLCPTMRIVHGLAGDLFHWRFVRMVPQPPKLVHSSAPIVLRRYTMLAFLSVVV